MKKKCTLIIAVIALILCLCACGSSAKNKDAVLPAFSQPKATQEAAPAEDAEASAEDAEEANEPEATEELAAEESAPSGIRPEFKEAMDSYEAFYDEYCELMAEYADNPTDIVLLGKYAAMMEKAQDMEEKFAAWEEDEMSSEELKYYLDVNNRIQKKLIDLF